MFYKAVIYLFRSHASPVKVEQKKYRPYLLILDFSVRLEVSPSKVRLDENSKCVRNTGTYISQKNLLYSMNALKKILDILLTTYYSHTTNTFLLPKEICRMFLWVQ